jgi:hypothetical protein
MGFDIYGIAPVESEDRSSPGEYFRNNVWWWRPLWTYIMEVCTELTEKQKEAGFWNDGTEIDEKAAEYIKVTLKDEIEQGKCFTYQVLLQARLDAMSDEDCNICVGTGERDNWTGFALMDTDKAKNAKIECNGCKGEGKTRPFATNYPFSVDNVQEFVNFLEHSHGFEIN